MKEVALYPSLWAVDVWVCDNPNQIAKAFHKRYGASVDYYLEENYPNRCIVISSTESSELKGRSQIILQVENFDMSVIVHELVHVMWAYAKQCGLEMNYKSQEWQAITFEYLYNECQPNSGFKSITKYLKDDRRTGG